MSWQRQWGGGRMKHGPQQLVFGDIIVETTTYSGGRKHGRYELRNRDFETTGKYVNDVKDGVWTNRYRDSSNKACWRAGTLDGPYETEWPGGYKSHFIFTSGRITEVNGKPVQSHLFDLLAAGVIDKSMSKALTHPNAHGFISTSLQMLPFTLEYDHPTVFMVDEHRLKDFDPIVSANLDGVDLWSALTIFTIPNGLDCDYRYGCVWITTTEDASDWHDPTGIMQIELPKGSNPARYWNQRVSFECYKEPLAQALSKFPYPTGLTIDTTQIEPQSEDDPAYPLTARLNDLAYRHVLGIVLYQTGCRCKLEGDRLVIVPPDNATND